MGLCGSSASRAHLDPELVSPVPFRDKYKRKVTGLAEERFLGQGSFGRVVLIEEIKSKNTLALKMIAKRKRSGPDGDEKLLRSLRTEITILRRCGYHENVLQLVDVYRSRVESTPRRASRGIAFHDARRATASRAISSKGGARTAVPRRYDTPANVLLVQELASGGDLMGWATDGKKPFTERHAARGAARDASETPFASRRAPARRASGLPRRFAPPPARVEEGRRLGARRGGAPRRVRAGPRPPRSWRRSPSCTRSASCTGTSSRTTCWCGTGGAS